MNSIYLPRSFSNNNKKYSEKELLAESNYIVVLAEAGGGKTEVLKSLAKELSSSHVSANKFAHIEPAKKNCPLIIDAFDEYSGVDRAGIYKILAKIQGVNPTHVIISSRSSEWGQAETSTFQEFLDQSPLVVRLCEFNEAEQRLIFESHVQGESFLAFQTEVDRFDLAMLLPNPQFLKLFADAYVESGRHFTDKKSIFEKAIERLSREANISVARQNTQLSITQKVDLSSEVFAKILLSAVEGVSINEATEDRMFPCLASILDNNIFATNILATNLFRAGDKLDQHCHVHKIVAEYCAASYLTKRIANEVDHLTLHKCLPIIAPNSIVRDELRGLLGWMAALGGRSIQETIIALDPYAVLANGDPSQLEHSSKRLMIKQLKLLEDRDPYFRRGDFMRSFSAAGFFTHDVANEIKPLLSAENDGHLRDLLLELLVDSPAIKYVIDELRNIILKPTESENSRLLAARCLPNLNVDDLDALIIEGSTTSLYIVSEIIEKLDANNRIQKNLLLRFFQRCIHLYPQTDAYFDNTNGSRYFIKSLIATLDLVLIEWLLDELTKELACICGKEHYACYCRIGISKIVGSMLDHYFELAQPPFDPIRIWNWIGNLHFHQHKTAIQSRSVQVFQKDHALRQGIIAHIFAQMTDYDKILETKFYMRDRYVHEGLEFQVDDYRFIINLAFDNNNSKLWACFIERHQYYRRIQSSNDLRHHMRNQAREKPLFMKEWVTSSRDARNLFENNLLMRRKSHARRLKHLRKKEDCRITNIRYIQENREIVESGKNWEYLVRFANLVLLDPDKVEHECGDTIIVRNALTNCLDYIAPYIPDLMKLAELQCASQTLYDESILYAACLEIVRTKGNLEGVDIHLLRALRTNIKNSYSAVSSEEREALKKEVDRLIFTDSQSSEEFLRQYLEPQLAQSNCTHTDIWLLQRDDAFNHLRPSLSIEWLGRYRDLPLMTLDPLFETAVQYGDRDKLKELILEYSAKIMLDFPSQTENEYIEQKRIFWLIRAWYFCSNIPEAYWGWLKNDKNTVLILYEYSGQMSHRDHYYWPKLTPNKVGAILDAFIEKWPKIELPSHWGTDSPKEENAYRFLTEVIWVLNTDTPDDAIPVLNRLLADSRFTDMHNNLKSIYAMRVRKKCLRAFEPPTTNEIVNLLDRDEVVTVEGLRQLVLQELQDYQKDIDGGEFDTVDRFYEGDKRLGEIKSTKIIAERLRLRLESQGISVTREHELKNANRSDFTVTKMIGGKRRLLVTEVKGQWHSELYSAASAQLYDRYSIHPDAEKQGVFLVIWFGENEKIAGLKNCEIKNAQELKESIEEKLPSELVGLIDVFVLDVSRPS